MAVAQHRSTGPTLINALLPSACLVLALPQQSTVCLIWGGNIVWDPLGGLSSLSASSSVDSQFTLWLLMPCLCSLHNKSVLLHSPDLYLFMEPCAISLFPHKTSCFYWILRLQHAFTIYRTVPSWEWGNRCSNIPPPLFSVKKTWWLSRQTDAPRTISSQSFFSSPPPRLRKIWSLLCDTLPDFCFY